MGLEFIYTDHQDHGRSGSGCGAVSDYVPIRQRGAGFLVGVAWSLINLYFLKGMVTELITPNETRKDVAIVLGFIKFPILYVGGYLISRFRLFLDLFLACRFFAHLPDCLAEGTG